MLQISNGRMIDPASGVDARRDIWLDGDRIVRVAPPGGAGESERAAGETLDASRAHRGTGLH